MKRLCPKRVILDTSVVREGPIVRYSLGIDLAPEIKFSWRCRTTG